MWRKRREGNARGWAEKGGSLLFCCLAVRKSDHPPLSTYTRRGESKNKLPFGLKAEIQLTAVKVPSSSSFSLSSPEVKTDAAAGVCNYLYMYKNLSLPDSLTCPLSPPLPPSSKVHL